MNPYTCYGCRNTYHSTPAITTNDADGVPRYFCGEPCKAEFYSGQLPDTPTPTVPHNDDSLRM